MRTTTAAYEARADEYIHLLGSMEAVHPSDRQLVDTWASTLTGPVLDAGCGPGHWTAHLADRGLDVSGVDLVPRFIAHAAAAHPGIPFRLASIDDLDAASASLGGILSWFSTIHHDPGSLKTPLGEFARVVRPDGGLLLGFFTGAEVEAFDHAVATAYRWPVAEIRRRVDAAGFDVVETHTRETRGARPVGALVCVRRG
ncbi:MULTISPECIES: class I SAM-dependent methyltransferase [Microbacterium]|uniref:class I SAM-dependent methyltransferase n=1 Tax=Microbacterium TaxID=33882 RepID=UPI0027876C25|nr:MULTISPECIES: class I SAM-dependent methyltransferase [Microbacterium]MDQ1082640.1 SAM-dependent methyltransferase [Microbacterium sp. SORGH_AS_0344]MDQ1168588.1 SAM-dependent methyltransferase [Microbacterium proteolyticum]